ncbi:hypothetical protein AMAG_13372 [Allomyces macrogynus ATCC 38327]|uniref:fructose-2,6-bisphosphate 2-phosphatase n=1 Tax=Allomyces macrogynus (strain ATCC 38327) TaxID=578462 RepID=A0A0L0T262_ALLM3|nr:hypothetical protein AMAG_13372 [Allomyces macrogynus ATCC 38327]|eukprot:KNE68730.1 hypothetical protein AMAG_13372 [Allomyces macrogynus ATCC 38327]
MGRTDPTSTGLARSPSSYIAQKICRYLEWTGTSCKVFNVGQYRRKTAGTNCRSDFFDPKNKDAIALRQEAASMALADMMTWFFQEDGCVAIYDATNTTHERREYILGVCKENHVDVVFIESICHDPDVIINNIAEVKISGPDYAGMDPEVATEDFKARMRHYESAYETISENDLAFVKLINVGSLVIVNLIKGWLQSRIVYFLMNLHTQPRRILFSRHGESMYNLKGLLGGDADLSPRGHLYAQSLPSVIRRALGGSADADSLTVWTSTLKRTQQTAAYLRYPKLAWKALDELDAGVCDGMTYEEVEAKYPEDYLERDADKFRYRYRGGESYHDLVVRLEPIIMELERQRNILIIGHQAVLRCIYAYFMKIPHNELPYTKIPLHTVISITPRAHGCDEERYSLDIPAVDTHRDPRRGLHPTTNLALAHAAQHSGAGPNHPAAATAADRASAVRAPTPHASPATLVPMTDPGAPRGPDGVPLHIRMSSRIGATPGFFPPSPATPRPMSPEEVVPEAKLPDPAIPLGTTPAVVIAAEEEQSEPAIKTTLVEPEPVDVPPSPRVGHHEAEGFGKIIGGELME